MTTPLEEVGGGGFAVARAFSEEDCDDEGTKDDCSTNAASSNAAVVVITVRLGSICGPVFKTREFRFDYCAANKAQ
jgi:hypothetical protein